MWKFLDIFKSSKKRVDEHLAELEKVKPIAKGKLLGMTKEQEAESSNWNQDVFYPTRKFNIEISTIIPEKDIIQKLKDEYLIFVDKKEYLSYRISKIKKCKCTTCKCDKNQAK